MPQATSVRVLLLDDERAIADSLALILQARGYRARAVYTAEAAIIVARDFEPHFLISDTVISGMNGVELATYFARHFPACKVLLISGNAATAGMLKDAVRHHNFSFMQKPVPPQRILEFLANCTSIA